MSECKACKKRGKTWDGSDPTCAFVNLVWSPDNWRCATDGFVRDLVEDPDDLPDGATYRYCDEQKYATLDVSLIELESGRALTLWLTWYKSRGRTEQAWLLSEDGPPRRPTELDLLTILAAYKAAPDTQDMG